MSSYFSKITGITLDDLNNTLSAVSNMVAPLADDEENEDTVNDVRDFSYKLSQVGDIVKSTIVSTSGYMHPLSNQDSSFEDVALSTPDRSSSESTHDNPVEDNASKRFPPGSGSAAGASFSQSVSSWDWGMTPPIEKAFSSKLINSNAVKRDQQSSHHSVVSLSTVELEKSVHSNYRERMESEIAKLSLRVQSMEAEKNTLLGTIRALESNNHRDRAISNSAPSSLPADSVECGKKLVTLESEISRLVVAQLEATKELCEKDSTNASLMREVASLADELSTFTESRARMIEDIEELEDIGVFLTF